MTCGKQATFVLVWFRKRADLAVLGAGFGISRATAYRYRDEALDVLAARAPELTDALDRVRAEGWSYVVLDGTVIDADRCAARRLFNERRARWPLLTLVERSATVRGPGSAGCCGSRTHRGALV